MSLLDSLNDSANTIICQGCLGTEYNVMKTNQIINIQFKTLLQSNVDVKVSEDIYLCVYCVARVRNIHKFIDQCTHINNNYFEMFYSHNVPQSNYFTLSHTEVFNDNIYSETDNDVKVENENDDCIDFDVGLCSDDDVPLISFKNENVKNEELNVYDHNNIKQEENESIFRTTNDNTKKIKEEELTKDYKKRTKKKLKVLPKGFTSRMVQETEEYIVLKLTKEQVLEEMRVKSASDKYVYAPYKCDKCVLGFNFEDVLESHKEKHSKKSGTVQCDICYQYWPQGVSMRGHMKSHTTRYQCKLCPEVHKARQTVVEHFRIRHSNDTITYKCDQCTFYTCKRTVFQRHVQIHKTSLEYSCDKCGKAFKNKDSLRIHISRHDKMNYIKCTKCTRRFCNKYLLESHLISHLTKNDTFYCVECDIMFKSRVTLHRHYQKSKAHTHSSSETAFQHKCKICDQTYDSQHLLNTHSLSIHGQDDRVACTVCQKKFATNSSMRYHYRLQHTDYIKPEFTCHLCGHTFSDRSVLVKHIRTHTGERPYECPECGLRFAQHGTRYTHIRVVHKKLPRSAKKAKELQQKVLSETQEP